MCRRRWRWSSNAPHARICSNCPRCSLVIIYAASHVFHTLWKMGNVSPASFPLLVKNQTTEPYSGREKKRQKLHSEPDDKDGNTLRLEAKDDNDHGLAAASTLETIDFQS